MRSRRLDFTHGLAKSGKGPYIKDVRTEGGRGGLSIARFRGQIVLIGCVKCGQRGEGGVENHENFADVLYVRSPMATERRTRS